MPALSFLAFVGLALIALLFYGNATLVHRLLMAAILVLLLGAFLFLLPLAVLFVTGVLVLGLMRLIPREGAIIFGDLIGKLDVLYIHCPKCSRAGRYRYRFD